MASLRGAGWWMANEMRERVAKNLQRHLDLRKWNVDTLAKKSKVSRSTLYNILNQECAASIDAVHKINKAMKMHSWALFVDP